MKIETTVMDVFPLHSSFPPSLLPPVAPSVPAKAVQDHASLSFRAALRSAATVGHTTSGHTTTATATARNSTLLSL